MVVDKVERDRLLAELSRLWELSTDADVDWRDRVGYNQRFTELAVQLAYLELGVD